ncbi:MAG: AAA family ATPase [Pseudomonadota bacterium]
MEAMTHSDSVVTPLPSAQAYAQRKGQERLLSIASGKGGVGKTWLSITLAHCLAQRGQRILLFDGDLGLANIDVQLGLNPDMDLVGALSTGGSLKEAATAVPETGFDVLVGRSGASSLAGLSKDALVSLTQDLTALAFDYDRVLLDLGAGIDSVVRHMAGTARTCLVVATDEPTSLTDAYAFMKLSWRENPEADLRVVINMAENRREGERTYATLKKACASFLLREPPLAGVIRRDKAIKDAIRHQSPTLTRYPSCSAAADVEALAAEL